MKDVPSAAIFAVNLWLLWRLVKHKRLSDLFLAVLGFAVAFNVKINSIFIPIVFATWLLIRKLLNPKHEILKNVKKNNTVQVSNFRHLNLSRISILEFIYFIAAPIAAFLLWWVFWPNPIAQLDHAYRTFAIGTNNIESYSMATGTAPVETSLVLPILVFRYHPPCLFYFFPNWTYYLIRHRRPIGIFLLLWFFCPSHAIYCQISALSTASGI